MSRWKTYRSDDDSIPSTPYEAAIFLNNAWRHLRVYGLDSLDARELLTDAGFRINFFEEVA